MYLWKNKVKGAQIMYSIAFEYLENDIELQSKIEEYFNQNTKMKSKPLDGMETILAIVTIAGFTI